jgi:hypothetical protein
MISMLDPIREARAGLARYWHIDGLTEIGAGVVQLLAGAGFAATAGAHGNSPVAKIVALTCTLLLLSFALLQKRIVRAIRARITYPRIGYVQASDAGRFRSVIVAVIVALLCFAAAGVAYRVAGATGNWESVRWMNWAPAVFGLLFGATALYCGVRLRLSRLLMLGVFAVLVGAGASVALPLRSGLALYFVAVGLGLLSSGGSTLWTHVRSASIREAQE